MIDSTHEKPMGDMPSMVRNLWNSAMIWVISHSTGVRILYSHPQKPLSSRN